MDGVYSSTHRQCHRYKKLTVTVLLNQIYFCYRFNKTILKDIVREVLINLFYFYVLQIYATIKDFYI